MRFIFRAIAFMAAGIALATCSGRNETRTEHFNDVSSMKEAHMIEKGWVPAFIAKDATNIWFDEDQDAASVYGTYVSGDSALLRSHCSDAPNSLRVPKHGPKWFLDDLSRGDTAITLRSSGYKVLHCDEGGFNVVADESRKFLYYWSARH